MKKNIAVIFGGKSTEHDISILSAIQVMSAIKKEKYNIIPIYISQSGVWFGGDCLTKLETFKNFEKHKSKLKEVAILPGSQNLFVKSLGRFKKAQKIDCVIVSCHGKNGEDGTLQGLLELSNIPYSSSGVLGSAVGMDKLFAKQIFAQNKIPITEYVALRKENFYEKNFVASKIENLPNYPVVVKPNRLGSSIGISVCHNDDELLEALKLSFLFDEISLIEKCVENLKEVNISVLGDENGCKVSITEEVNSKNELLTFQKKYITKDAKNLQKTKEIDNFGTKNAHASAKNGMQNIDRIMPAKISKHQQKQIETYAKKIFNITNCKGVVRIDFLIDQKTKKVYANEINTIPGSFAFYLWQKTGLEFSQLVDTLVEIATKHRDEESKLVSTFQSNVI